MDRPGLADFLRHRREALGPADVGLPPGVRRRTAGLRREEVALLAGMSTDYYTRLEQARGPQPSVQVLTALTRALRLDLDERDHLFRLAGHPAPTRSARTDHVAPALLRVLDRLDDTPALVVSDLGEVLAQNRMARALFGDQTGFAGVARSSYYRWFAGEPSARALFPGAAERMSAVLAAHLRTAIGRGGEDDRSRELVAALLAESPEFRAVWERHEVNRRHDDVVKTIRHPEVGDIALHCQRLTTDNQAQALLVFTAAPGSEAAERLRLLDVIGDYRGSVSTE